MLIAKQIDKQIHKKNNQVERQLDKSNVV